LGGVQAGACQNAKRVLKGLNGVGGKAAALEADAISAVDLQGMVGCGNRVRKDVLLNDAIASDHGVTADAAELMDGTQAADVGVILDDNVAGEGDAIGENDVVIDRDIVRHVDIRHHQIAISDAGDHATALRAAVNGDEFPDGIVIADASFRGLAPIFFVLRGDTARGIRIEDVVLSDCELAFEIGMGHQARARADCDAAADDAIGSDVSVRRNFGAGINNGGRVNCHPVSAIANSAMSGHLVLRDLDEGRGFRGAIRELAHQAGFRDYLPINGRFALDFCNCGFQTNQLHFDA
jgi:hypothetical protein